MRIKWLHLSDIHFNYANYESNSLRDDFIQEIRKAQQIIDSIENLDTENQQVLFRMALSYIISIMDAYLGDTFRYYVEKYEKFKEQYEIGRKKSKEQFRSLKTINEQSFQNINKTVKLYQLAFNIELSGNQLIQDAAQKRNRIIHHSSRDEDGYEILITASELKDLLAEIESYVKTVGQKIIDVVYEEIIIRNRPNNEQ